MVEMENNFICKDCGDDTRDENINDFVVKDFLWKKYGCPGRLCVHCFQKRMGRRLKASDFKDLKLNDRNPYVRVLRKEKGMGIVHVPYMQRTHQWNVCPNCESSGRLYIYPGDEFMECDLCGWCVKLKIMSEETSELEYPRHPRQ